MHRVPILETSDKERQTTPEDSVWRAARALELNNRDPVLVRSGGRPVGVITEDDIVAKVLAPGRDPRTVRVSEIMELGILARDGASLLVEDDGVAASPLHDAESLSRTEDMELEPGRELVQRGLCEECETEQEYLFDLEGAVLCEDCYETHADFEYAA